MARLNPNLTPDSFTPVPQLAGLHWLPVGAAETVGRIIHAACAVVDHLEHLDDETDPGQITVAIDAANMIAALAGFVALGMNVAARDVNVGQTPASFCVPPAVPGTEN